MPTIDNWIVTVNRDPQRRDEDTWIANAKRGDFEFTQIVSGNEGEIAAFCKTARTMYRQHEADKVRGQDLAKHFDEILEAEDQREIDEKAAAEQKKIDDEMAAKIAADQAALQAKADADKAEADRIAAESAAAQPIVEPTPESPVAETSTPEGSDEKVS